ncbi:hypothetical protein [Massilia consociata]|uniref:asparagine synthase (glutamine-hydrolyzing) n=1 Tax=Massilia consociata TaxID=760117 RepID=A0ABV6FBM8_9BURK
MARRRPPRGRGTVFPEQTEAQQAAERGYSKRGKMNVDLDLISRTYADVEFFLACVFPDSPPRFAQAVPSTLAVEIAEDFWAVSSRVPGNGKSLLHDIGGTRVLFRGYESEIGVHSYSSAERLGRLATPEALTNGAFAYLGFDRERQHAVVRSDAFGVAPLFYRQCGNGWLFASHPGLIRFAGDKADLNTWLSLMQSGLPLDDRSCYEGIARFEPGTQMTVRRDGARSERWFRFEDLPPGLEAIDDEAFAIVEAAYRRAMDRCLALDAESFTLPFSSGYDSRRFFATLLQKKVPFKAVTCQSFHRKKGKDYDIDSYFAPKIAAAFGVECELVHATPAAGLAADAQWRQSLIGSETFMHGWGVPFMRWLAKRPPSVVIDGLGGDTLGNTGFEIDGLHETPEKDRELLVKEVSRPSIFKELSGVFPTLADYQRHYRVFLAKFPSNLNQAEFAFLQSRTRRCISPWITMMHPPGHVIVFPYHDLDFARATLRYHPADKYKWFFQKECLKRFYPEYVDFHGSRNLPPDHPPLDAAESRARDTASEHAAYGDPATVMAALKYLNWKNRILLLLALGSSSLRRRRDWLFRPLLSLVRLDRQSKAFIDKDSAAVVGPAGQESGGNPVQATQKGMA